MVQRGVEELAVELLGKSADSLTRAERRVLQHISRRETLSRDMGVVHEEGAGFGERLADHVAAVGGSWAFLIGFALVLAGWMFLNGWVLAGGPDAFDPYPFIFLNLMLSTLAAIQAPVIMMSQNRQAAKDRAAAAHDYEVNLRAELEIIRLHEKINGLMADMTALKNGFATGNRP